MIVHRVWLQKRFLVAACLVVVCTGVAVGLFLSTYSSVARTSFQARTLAYAQAFAATAGSWLERGQTEVVATLAEVLVTGSILGVEIARADGERVVGAGADIAAIGAKAGGRESAALVEVPMPAAGGRLRMVADSGSVEASVRHMILAAVAVGIAFDGTLLSVVAWALRGRRRTVSEAGAPQSPPADVAKVVVGDLVIVPTRCEASYAGQSLRLTPKQFALLSVLASEPGRVFTEPEILAAAWPDSAYADARDIKQYIYLLRRRMAAVRPDGRDVIVTVPGFGYRLADGR